MPNNIPQNLEEELKQIIAFVIEIEPEKVTPDARFIQDLGMDSIKTVELVVAIEQKFKIRIREEELPKIATLRQAVELAKRIMSKGKVT